MTSPTARLCLVLLLSLLSAATSRADWSQEFRLKDYLGIYEFPEEMVSYPVDLNGSAVKTEDLRLFLKGTTQPLVFQLTEVQEEDGRLKKAVIHFRTDLKLGEDKVFILTQSSQTPPARAEAIGLANLAGDRLAINANQLQVLVPAGSRDLNLPVSSAPAPLLALAREPGKWVGAGKLTGPNDLIVQQINSRVVERGPLFVTYAVTYRFPGDRWYSVELKVQLDEAHVEISETEKGFVPSDGLAFRFSYKDGVDPNGRLLMANGGYSTGGPQQGASGAYAQGVGFTGVLPIKLGLYTPNSINLPRAIAFWNDAGANAILFALHRLPDWKTSQRALWSATSLPDNLEFYDQGGDKFVRAAVVGGERHWAISLIARADMIVRGIPRGDTVKIPRPADQSWEAVSSMRGLLSYGGGPEVRLLQKLNDFSLDRYKDLVFDFPEDDATTYGLPDITPKDMTGGEFVQSFGPNFFFLAQVGWDYSGDLGPNHWGWATGPETVNYAHNFARWTPPERLQARSWLVFAASLLELDTAMPQSSMLGGHPNFLAEFKQILGLAPGLFPKHPHATRWRDAYLKMWAEYLDLYVRKPDETTGARGGRFTENIANYNGASMEAVLNAATGLKRFDGTQILDRPALRDWARWDMECRLPYRAAGARLVPSEGAHADVTTQTPGGRWYQACHALALLLRDTAPRLADEWLWSITAGAEGKRPEDIQSDVFVDYGPVFHYDFGGPDEAYLQLQQLNGIGYRWTPASNGALYYAAKGKVWSWNQSEKNGDAFDIEQIPAFHCAGKVSLGAEPARGVLYNFGFAQYYRADASSRALLPPPYKYRSVVMVRGDYVAVYDHVQEGVPGTFNWVNESNGLVWQLFSDPDFKQPLKTFLNDRRFPQGIDASIAEALGLPRTFSIRASGGLTVPVAGHYHFETYRGAGRRGADDTPAGDTFRMYLDEVKVFDGKGPATAEVDLEARNYTVRSEYVHASDAPPLLRPSWIKPGETQDGELQKDSYIVVDPPPFIQEIKGGPGDQLHIVAPQKIAVAAVPAGACIGTGEYILVSDEIQNVTQDDLVFQGKAAYARAGELALFEGTKLAYKGLGLSREDGDFGASVKQVDPKLLEGRVAGRAGGTLHVQLPPGIAADGLQVTFDGQEVRAEVQNGTVSFPVAIKQADGCKAFRISAK